MQPLCTTAGGRERERKGERKDQNYRSYYTLSGPFIIKASNAGKKKWYFKDDTLQEAWGEGAERVLKINKGT